MTAAIEAGMVDVGVRYAFSDGIATVTLCDPRGRNALTSESLAALGAAMRRAVRDRAVVVVLTAEGPFFSVGGDIGRFAATDDPWGLIDDMADNFHRTVSEMMRMDAIVVAVVRRTVAGGGVALAAAADVVVAGDAARFTVAYSGIGLSVDGGTSMLVHSLGLHRTLRLALLNDVLSATDAMEAGLVARVFPDERVEAEALAIARQLADGPAAAQASTKRLLRTAAEPNPEARLRAEALAVRHHADSPRARAAFAAFGQK